MNTYPQTSPYPQGQGPHDFKTNQDFPPPPPYSAGPQQADYAPQTYGTGQELPYPAQPVAGFPSTQFLPATSQGSNPSYFIPAQQTGYPMPMPMPMHIPPMQNTSQQMVYQNPNNSDDNLVTLTSSDQNMEDPNWKGFSDKAIRNAFIRKVYAILMVQLAFTVGVIALFIFHKGINAYVKQSFGMYMAAYVLFLGIYITLVCCNDLRRKYPHNIILLSVFTICLTYLVATISCFHETEIVIMALGICSACCLVISIFACFTKFDLTSCHGVLFILVWVLFFFGILCIFTRNHIMNTVYAGLGALVFMLFLAFDTQMVMGGKKYQLSPEEYIYASLQLYMDIVQIFLFLLSLLGGGRK